MLARLVPEGLFAKYLLVLVPSVLCVVGFGALLGSQEQAAGEMLAARIGSQAVRVSALLARHTSDEAVTARTVFSSTTIR
ncbi:MAG: hypothetical protein ACI8W7_001753 [Gammaproteobacteria bacterium]|jgi:hypothetical protein